MEPEWKHTIFTYVNQYNQCQIDYRSPASEQVVTDPVYLMMRSERMRRLSQWYVDRAVQPLRSETRARLLRNLHETPQELVVDIQLYTQMYYSKGGITHREEIIQRERLTLIRDGDDWVIIGIENLMPEKHPVAEVMALPNMVDGTLYQDGTQPLLSTQVFGTGSSKRAVKYRREDAVAYANRWWDSSNPEFSNFDVNCTNYISQCLFAGGAPIHYTGKRESGWWYKGYLNGKEWWSYSWSVANALERYLTISTTGLRAELVERPEQLLLGDVIIYDWDGDGSYQHSTIVTAFDAGGMPLVNAHTVSSRHRYWDYRDSYAWTDNTVYRFLHIPDYL